MTSPSNRMIAMVARRIGVVSEGSLARRWARTVATASRTIELKEAILAVLLVEVSARPATARAVEWASSYLLRHSPIPPLRQRGEKLTVGPLQLQGGPWQRKLAVDRAVAILVDSQESLSDNSELARIWNGTVNGRPRKRYVSALDVARPIAQRLLTEARE